MESKSKSGLPNSDEPTSDEASSPNPADAVEIPGWHELGLSADALKTIEKAGYKKPTPVQAQTIPISLAGHDVIASAQTGTGKTASFVLPMVEHFAGRKGTYGLILAPTREIAQQTQATIDVLGKPRGVSSIVLIGGVRLNLDEEALLVHPNIIVATPGRLCDHLNRGKIWLDFLEILVLDEADRMLDMGFSDQLNRIMEEVPNNCQRLLFSATIHPNVEKLASRILFEPKKIVIGKPRSASKNVTQTLLWVHDDMKNRELRRILRAEKGSVMVFVRSKESAARLWRNLQSDGFYDATCIHSDRLQAHREQALAEFKEGKYRILIATDVVGRGIHVDSVAHVVNYDLPLEAEDYVHRIGRTGRKDEVGEATSFVTPGDRRLLQQIERLLGHPVPAVYSEGFNDNAEPRSSGRDDKRRPRRDDRSSSSRPRPGSKPSQSSIKNVQGTPPKITPNPIGKNLPAANAAKSTAVIDSPASDTDKQSRRPKKLMPGTKPDSSND